MNLEKQIRLMMVLTVAIFMISAVTIAKASPEDTGEDSHEDKSADKASDNGNNDESSRDDNVKDSDEGDKVSDNVVEEEKKDDSGTTDELDTQQEHEDQSSETSNTVAPQTDEPAINTSPNIGAGDQPIQEEKPIAPQNDPCKYGSTNVCEGSPDGKTCNEEKFDCLSDGPDGKPCTTGQCVGDDKPIHKPGWCDIHKDACGPHGPKCGHWNNWCNHPHPNWCDHHDCRDDHHHHDHNHDHHDYTTKNYYYYYTNDYNNNHATVILQPDYSHSKDYHDIRVVIGDSNEFDTTINFNGKPDNLVITGLDIDENELFDVCMKNEHNDKTNCVKAELHDEDKPVYVDIRVP